MNEQELREKVIKGLDKLKENSGCIAVYDCDCKTCPYERVNGCCSQVLEDALALLKAQEPVKPLKMEVDYVRKEPVVFSYKCPVCMCSLQRHWVACPTCGTGVKWE